MTYDIAKNPPFQPLDSDSQPTTIPAKLRQENIAISSP